MKKRIISFVLILVMSLSMFSVYALATDSDFSGGSGTEADPYLISTKAHLNNVRKYLSAHFKMTSDIEFTDADFEAGGAFYNNGAGFEPIGNWTSPFTGTFDGDEHTIKNIHINMTSTNTIYSGLFNCNEGTIKNIGLVDCSISSDLQASGHAGSITGENYGTITNCYSTGAVSALSPTYVVYAGGIAGANIGIIEYCYNTCAVSASSPSSAYIGGIAGYNSGTIENCYNTGDVSAYHYTTVYIGGIVGDNYRGKIENCYNTGAVSAFPRSAYIGGIAGYNRSTIANCYNTGDVSANSSSYTGGIAGYNYSGTITNCYYIDTISNGAGYGADTATKCTAFQLKVQSTFEGFDFNNTWEFVKWNAYTYPTLKNNEHFIIDENAEFQGGSGTEADPYLISTKAHLNNVRKYLSAHFKMTSDIEFTDADFEAGGEFYNNGAGFEPIGNSDNKFTGTFDGGGFEIKNISIETNNQAAALFVYNEGTIKNLGVSGGRIVCVGTSAAAFAASNSGTIENCSNTASVSLTVSDKNYAQAGGIAASTSGRVTGCVNEGEVYALLPETANTQGSVFRLAAGGIVGNISFASSEITDCTNKGKITTRLERGTSSTSSSAGGIVGSCGSMSITDGIKNCSNEGEITASTGGSYANAGGIVGDWSANESSIKNCHNTGKVTASDAMYGCAGGVVGSYSSNYAITKCYNVGSVDINNVLYAYAGGITGNDDINVKITTSYNSGKVTANGIEEAYAGGITGNMSGYIEECYNTEHISAYSYSSTWTSYSCAGGIAGFISSNDTSSWIKNCYNIGNASATSGFGAYAGGIIGGLRHDYPQYNHGVQVEHCYNMGELFATDLDTDPQYNKDAFVGGIIGYDGNNVGPATECVYLDNTLRGTGKGVDSSYKRTKSQMLYSVNYRNFDFENVWCFDKSGGYRYAQLSSLKQPHPTKIEVATQPTDNTYKEGLYPNLSGATYEVFYEDLSYYVRPLEYYDMLYNFDVNTTGEQKVVLSLGSVFSEKTVDFVGKPKVLLGIEVIRKPDRVDYHQDEATDSTGIWVVANYDNASSETITDFELENFNATTVGTSKVTVNYKGYTTTFDINVSAHKYFSSYDYLHHYRGCYNCKMKFDVAEHVFENDCDTNCACGYTRKIQHDYKPEFDNRFHFDKCSVCNDKKNVQEHEFENACDTTCDCGYIRSITHDYKPSFDAENHFDKCTVCGDKINVKPHEFVNTCDTDCDCGYIRRVTHDYKTTFEADIHYDECTVCGDKINVWYHEFENTCDTDCYCGFTRFTEHMFGDYVYNEDATYENDGTKTRYCIECGYSETEIAEGTKLYNNGWIYEGGWVYYQNGIKLTNCWLADSVGWCYVGSDGYCVTNQWMADSIGWCYLNSEGRMATNQWIMDSQGWCYVGSDGYCVTNQWMADSIGWCYLDSNGRMATNQWIMDSQGWCYVGANGYCLTNCWMADSIGWCYLDASGRMVVNGWIRDSYGLCWLDESGYWDGIYY